MGGATACRGEKLALVPQSFRCNDEPPDSQARKWSHRELYRYANSVVLEEIDDQVSEGKVVLTQKTWSI